MVRNTKDPLQEQVDCVRSCWSEEDAELILGIARDCYRIGLTMAARMASARSRHTRGATAEAMLRIAADLREMAKE